jgi:hypothetical protein
LVRAIPDETHVDFEIEGAALQAKVREMSEQSDGFTYHLKGTLLSPPYADSQFEATYHVGTRTGSIEIVRPVSPTVPVV